MPKSLPPPEGAVLRFFRFSKGLNEEELAEILGVSPHAIGRWENGVHELTRGRLEELLAAPPLEIPPEAIATALRAHELGNPPQAPGSPSDPAGAEGRLLDRGAAAGGKAGAHAALAGHAAGLARRVARKHRRWAAERWSRLAKLETGKQEKVVETLAGDERSWALAERIAVASETAAAHRADEALRLARLAVRLAERVPDPAGWRLCVMAHCEPFVANALRVGGDLAASARSFAWVEDLARQGRGGDPAGLLDGTRRLDLKASLLMYQGQLDEALSLLDQALEKTKTDKARGRLLLKRATVLEMAGEYEAAVVALRQMEPLDEGTTERRLLFGHRFNLTVNFCHLEVYREVERLLPMVEAMADQHNELDGFRLLWLRGRAWAGLGRKEEALAALAQVRQHFLSEEIAYDFALVSVEVSVLHLEQGRTRLVRQLAREMLWIFKSQGVHKEALAALALFCHAARKEEAEAGWARRLVKYLYRVQYKPGLRFEG